MAVGWLVCWLVHGVCCQGFDAVEDGLHCLLLLLEFLLHFCHLFGLCVRLVRILTKKFCPDWACWWLFCLAVLAEGLSDWLSSSYCRPRWRRVCWLRPSVVAGAVQFAHSFTESGKARRVRWHCSNTVISTKGVKESEHCSGSTSARGINTACTLSMR